MKLNNVHSCLLFTPLLLAPLGAPRASDIVISEVMQNPAAVADSAGEWFELANTTSEPIALDGWKFSDDDSDSFVVSTPLTIAANGFVVLGRNGNTATNGGVALDYVYSGLTLANGADELVATDSAGTVVDRVAWDGGPGFPDPTGVSMALIDASLDNLAGSNWCESSTPYGSGDAGTPGAENDCGGLPGDPVPVTIMDVQGRGHRSELLNQRVATSGVVTAVDSNAFYLQDAEGDGDPDTSDAILVFTSSTPTVSVGDAIDIVAQVKEYVPGGSSTGNLSITELVEPAITVTAIGQSVPTTVLGHGGRQLPHRIIDNDNFDPFDPAQDGLDFMESLEAMQVSMQNVRVVGPTNRFGEIFVTANSRSALSGRSQRGTMNISPRDFNPERIQIDDDSGLSPGKTPSLNVGDGIDSVKGVVTYNFGNYEVLFTEALGTVQPGNLAAERSRLRPWRNYPTVASFNVLNLDPNESDGDTDIADGRFVAVANIIVNNLNNPSIIALQEIQDSSGSTNDGTTSASATLELLVQEIAAAGGPAYAYLDNTFIGNNTNGGQPGANIRVAYLYDPGYVQLVAGSESAITDPIDQQSNSANPFYRSRLPLAANFQIGRQQLTLINVHLSSKGGSKPLYGVTQPAQQRQEDPAVNGSLDDRQTQANAIGEHIDALYAENRNHKVVVLGDFNEYEFISPLSQILSSRLINLTRKLPRNERYSYIYQGNSQSLDHILVSPNLYRRARFDAVHVNAEFAESQSRASDHDPLLVRLSLRR